MISIHNNSDPKRPKAISKGIGEYAHAHSKLTELLGWSMLQKREQREMKAIGKATGAARKAYEGLPI